jgi:hypothetical protein
MCQHVCMYAWPCAHMHVREFSLVFVIWKNTGSVTISLCNPAPFTSFVCGNTWRNSQYRGTDVELLCPCTYTTLSLAIYTRVIRNVYIYVTFVFYIILHMPQQEGEGVLPHISPISARCRIGQISAPYRPPVSAHLCTAVGYNEVELISEDMPGLLILYCEMVIAVSHYTIKVGWEGEE